MVIRLTYKIELMQATRILLAGSLLALAMTQQIIDYSHAQSLENTHFDLTKKYDIRIMPEYLE